MSAEAPQLIHAAIWKVMKSVTFVAKAGQYQGGKSGNYAFRRFDDTAAALGTAFREHGIFVQTHTINREVVVEDKPYSSGTGFQRHTTVRVEVAYVFTSLEDGSILRAESYGEGKDTSDKATAKAMTMALKTALTQSFMIPTDDPDPDSVRPGDNDAVIGRGDGGAQSRQQSNPRSTPPAPEPDASTAEEKRIKYAEWALATANGLRQAQDFGQLLTRVKAKGMLGYPVEGVPLGQRIQSVAMTMGVDPAAGETPDEPEEGTY